MNGVVAGEGRLVLGIWLMDGGAGRPPPGGNLDGSVPARARRIGEGKSLDDWDGSGRPLEGLSWMVGSRSLNEDGLLVLEIGPQRPGGFTPSSCWISLALPNGKHEFVRDLELESIPFGIQPAAARRTIIGWGACSHPTTIRWVLHVEPGGIAGRVLNW